MDILILSQFFHPEPTGSAPPITDLALWLAENGHQVSVLTARPSYPDRVVFDAYRNGARDQEVWRGVKVQRLKSFVAQSASLWGRFCTELSFAMKLFFPKKRAPYVVAVCPSIFGVAFARRFCSKDGRLVVIVHDIQSGLGASIGASSRIMRLLRHVERWALNRADDIITLSDGMAVQLVDIGVDRPIHILPPQIDVRALTPLPEPEGAFTALYSGALGKKQGLDQVLDAAALLLKRGSPIRFLIRGQGGVEAQLRERVAREGLANVRFEPLAPFEAYNAAMAQGHVHLVPQAPGGAEFAVPSKVFSIMGVGRPFLATSAPNAPLDRLALESGAGLCVPTGQPAALADALEELADSAAQRAQMGASGRRYVEHHVDRSVICSATAEILSGLERVPLEDEHK